MRYFIIVVFSVLCLCVTAQDNTTYILHDPTASEYLTAIPEIIELFKELDTSEYTLDTNIFRNLISMEFWHRFDKNQLAELPLEILYDAKPYLALRVGFDYEPDSIPGWHNIVFNTWLRETQPDLHSQGQWQFGAYTLLVDPVDFTGDGIDEYSVTLSYQTVDWVEFIEYFVLREDESSSEGYHRLGDKLNEWFGSGCSNLSCAGQGEIYRIEDINGDDLPEWIFSRGSCAYGRCAIHMEAFSYINGEFIDLFGYRHRPSIEIVSGGGGVRSSPDDGIWTFDNVDDDPATEIIQHVEIEDNRGCVFSTTQKFDWDADSQQYSVSEPEYNYDDSAWCALRQAHNTMKVLDIESAIEHYEHFLEFEPLAEVQGVWAYAQVRLSLAYLLAGDDKKADKMIASIDGNTVEDEGFRKFVEMAQTAYETDNNTVSFCKATYDSVRELGELLAYSGYVENNDYFVSLNYGGGDFSPANSGCNIELLFNHAIQNLDLSLPIDEQLTELGWKIYSEMELDLVSERDNEAIRWVSPINTAIYSWKDNKNIHISRVATANSPSANTALHTVTLGNGERLIVSIPRDLSGECQIDSLIYPGAIKIWRGNNEDSISVQSFTICKPQTLEQTFPNPNELHILKDIYGESKTYVWDFINHEFMFDSKQMEESQVSTFSEDYLSCYSTLYNLCSSLDKPDELISIIDTVLASPDFGKTANLEYGLTYLRAVVYESIGSESDALNDYLEIYETAQDTPWATLAELHLKRIQ